MANKKWVIDAAPLMKDGWHLVKTGKSNVFLASMSLADVQTVDAVEVVRCGKCDHWLPPQEGKGFCGTCHCPHWDSYSPAIARTKEDDFCSYGKRRKVI